MSKEGPRLSRLGVLAPAALSACMDASVMAVPAAGAIVSTVLKELSKAFMLKKWFHGTMSAKEAENLIMARGKNGSFLVRESQAHPGEYVVSVRSRNRVTHVMIRQQHSKYNIGNGEQFDDLVGLIEHFRSYPIIETSGEVLRLLQPVNGNCVRARDINQKVKEMQQESEDFDNLSYRCSVDGEFQSLWMLEDRHMYTTNEGLKPQNLSKNRYANVLPYDHSRVVLRGVTSDYINANYIRCTTFCDSHSSSSSESLNSVHSLKLQSRHETKKCLPLVSKSLSDDALKEIKRCINLDKINGNLNRDFVKNKMYIATQGCLPNTMNDFWHMIWQEDVRIIAMLTNEVEKGKKKCERYWPESGAEQNYADLTVKSITESFYEDYVVRELVVCDQKMLCRTIYHYQFTGWPDHKAPPEPDGVLIFMNDINTKLFEISQSMDSPEQNILCVHCSAGVGRTGTFIVLDMLLDKIKSAGYNCDIDVHSLVQLVRAQRSGLVQNKTQYKFIYLALQQFIDSKNFKIMKKV